VLETTVLIENALLFVVLGYSYSKSRKLPLLIYLFVVVGHMTADYALINSLGDRSLPYENMVYYWALSILFLLSFGIMMIRVTRISQIFAACLLPQSLISFMMAINGAELNGLTLPHYDIIPTIHEVFNSKIWGVECIAAYIAMKTNYK